MDDEPPMTGLSEADTCRKFVVPALRATGGSVFSPSGF
jgi:hypothetical protein